MTVSGIAYEKKEQTTARSLFSITGACPVHQNRFVLVVVLLLLILLFVLLLILLLVLLLILLLVLLVLILILVVHCIHHTFGIIVADKTEFIRREMIFLNPRYRERLCGLFHWDEDTFDRVYASECFRGIRVNTLKSDFETVQSVFAERLEQTPFYKDSYYISPGLSGVGNLPLHHAGAFYVQEPSACSVLSVVDARPGERILDLCAAPGGKSTGIAAGLGGQGILWTNEYVRRRANILLSNIERMGVRNAAVSSLEASYLCRTLGGFFDKVLVDAPCSGEGMWRHNPQVEQQWSEDYVAECAALQREILLAARGAVHPGGRLIYSTCTFSREENERNVEWFLRRSTDFVLEKISASFGREGLGGDPAIDSAVRRILPTDGGEGHFVASFRKTDGENPVAVERVEDNLSAESRKIVADFFEENFSEIPSGCFMEKNGFVYLAPRELPTLRGDILRYGLLVGELRKNRLEPAHALFAASGVAPRRRLALWSGDERVSAFLHGLEIPADGDGRGYIAVTVDGCPLGFGKQSGGRIANRYPKGLRTL